jgi:hypothetical protein
MSSARQGRSLAYCAGVMTVYYLLRSSFKRYIVYLNSIVNSLKLHYFSIHPPLYNGRLMEDEWTMNGE